MPDTDTLRPYRPAAPPTIEGGDRAYVAKELRKLEQSIALLVTACKALEARIAALEP